MACNNMLGTSIDFFLRNISSATLHNNLTKLIYWPRSFSKKQHHLSNQFEYLDISIVHLTNINIEIFVKSRGHYVSQQKIMYSKFTYFTTIISGMTFSINAFVMLIWKYNFIAPQNVTIFFFPLKYLKYLICLVKVKKFSILLRIRIVVFKVMKLKSLPSYHDG